MNTQNFVLVTWPENYYLAVPNTGGTINFPTPIPEFTSTVVVIVLTFAVAALVTRIRAQKRIYPE
jgi:hypothetical protein